MWLSGCIPDHFLMKEHQGKSEFGLIKNSQRNADLHKAPKCFKKSRRMKGRTKWANVILQSINQSCDCKSNPWFSCNANKHKAFWAFLLWKKQSATQIVLWGTSRHTLETQSIPVSVYSSQLNMWYIWVFKKEDHFFQCFRTFS